MASKEHNWKQQADSQRTTLLFNKKKKKNLNYKEEEDSPGIIFDDFARTCMHRMSKAKKRISKTDVQTDHFTVMHQCSSNGYEHLIGSNE